MATYPAESGTAAVALNKNRVHLDHEGGFLDHDRLLLDPDKTRPCSEIILGERTLKPVDINFPADIVNPVKTECNHNRLSPVPSMVNSMKIDSGDKTLRKSMVAHRSRSVCGNRGEKRISGRIHLSLR